MDVLRRKYAFLFKYKVFFPNHFFSELMQITCFNITYSVTLDNVNILKFHTQFSRFSYSWLGSWDSTVVGFFCIAAPQGYGSQLLTLIFVNITPS